MFMTMIRTISSTTSIKSGIILVGKIFGRIVIFRDYSSFMTLGMMKQSPDSILPILKKNIVI